MPESVRRAASGPPGATELCALVLRGPASESREDKRAYANALLAIANNTVYDRTVRDEAARYVGRCVTALLQEHTIDLYILF